MSAPVQRLDAIVTFRNPVTGATFKAIGKDAAERLERELPGMWVRV